jgi:hypothetical protein
MLNASALWCGLRMLPYATREILVAVQHNSARENSAGRVYKAIFCSMWYCILYLFYVVLHIAYHGSTLSALSLRCGIGAEGVGAMQEHAADHRTGPYLERTKRSVRSRGWIALSSRWRRSTSTLSGDPLGWVVSSARRSLRAQKSARPPSERSTTRARTPTARISMWTLAYLCLDCSPLRGVPFRNTSVGSHYSNSSEASD